MSETNKVAFLGTTHPHARSQVRTLQLVDEVESIYFCDQDEGAGDAIRETCPDKIADGSLSLDEVLTREDIEFCWGCFNTVENGPAVKQLLEAGKHVMSEKPVGISAAVIAELCETARANERTLSVCYQNRYRPIVQDIRRHLAEEAIGKLMNMEVRMVTSQVRYRNPKHWLFDREQSGGGILSWLMCHYFDMMRFLLGQEVVEVTSLTGILNGEDITVEDTASGALRFESGLICAWNAGYLLSMSREGFSNASYDTYFGIRGREGSLVWAGDVSAPSLTVTSTRSDWNRSSPSRTIQYSQDKAEGYGGLSGRDFVRQFFRAALHGEEPPTSGEDALQAARIVEACYESNDSGRAVKLVEA